MKSIASVAIYTTLPICLLIANVASVSGQSGTSNLTDLKTPSLPSPDLTFPSDEDMSNYYTEEGTLNYNNIFTNLSHNITGTQSNPQIVSAANSSFVAWQSKSLENNASKILISLSHDQGLNFTNPIQLNLANSTGDSTNLDMDAFNNTIFVTWQETGIFSGLSNVFASTSLDSGTSFKTWQLNLENSTAWDPRVSENGFVWTQSDIYQGKPCPIGSEYYSVLDVCFGKPDILYHRKW